jgi:hypothetical protein
MTSVYAGKQDGQRTEVCRIERLDDYVRENNLPKPDLIKMDVERSEIECIKGGIELINECHPLLVIEFHSKKLLVAGYELLERLGYKFRVECGPLSRDVIALSSEELNENVLCEPTLQDR